MSTAISKSIEDPTQRSIIQEIGEPDFSADRSVDDAKRIAIDHGVIPPEPVESKNPPTIFVANDMDQTLEMLGVFAEGELTGSR